MISAQFVVKRDEFIMDIKLDMPSDGATVLFGPSGSGKTTFINVLSGIVKPTSGIIRFGKDTFFDSENNMLEAYLRSLRLLLNLEILLHLKTFAFYLDQLLLLLD